MIDALSPRSSLRLEIRTMALLELLPGPTRTRIIAADITPVSLSCPARHSSDSPNRAAGHRLAQRCALAPNVHRRLGTDRGALLRSLGGRDVERSVGAVC